MRSSSTMVLRLTALTKAAPARATAAAKYGPGSEVTRHVEAANDAISGALIAGRPIDRRALRLGLDVQQLRVFTFTLSDYLSEIIQQAATPQQFIDVLNTAVFPPLRDPLTIAQARTVTPDRVISSGGSRTTT